MKNSLSKLRIALLSATFASLASVGSAQHTSLPGSAGMGANTCQTSFVYDTGAPQTLLDNACAQALGLLIVVPSGTTTMNGKVVWCYAGITIKTLDSFGTPCTYTGTVYVDWNRQVFGGNVSLLGRPLRKALKGLWDDDTEKVKWRNPSGADTIKPGKKKTDSSTGVKHMVIPDIKLSTSGFSVAADMVYSNGSEYSFIPKSVAVALGAKTVGRINLKVGDRDTLIALHGSEMNITGQTMFEEVLIKRIDLGIGSPIINKRFLVSSDANSSFGLIGGDLIDATNTGTLSYFDTDDLLYPEAGLAEFPPAK